MNDIHLLYIENVVFITTKLIKKEKSNLKKK